MDQHKWPYSYYFTFHNFLLSSLSLMGIQSLVPPAKPPSLHHNNNSNHHHHHYCHQYLGIRATNTLLIIIISIISIFILFAAFLSLLLYRRYRSTKSNLDGATSNNSSNARSTTTTNATNSVLSKFGSGSITSNSSPDVRNCLYGGNLGLAPAAKFRGGQVFTYKELEMATDKFSEANVIGNGGFGVVYRGTLSNGTIAAIKMLNRQGKQGEREFRVEVDLLSRLHSPYLLEPLGYCADQHHRLLIFEFLSNGNLQSHLHPTTTNKQYRPLDWGTRLRIALDCARGLEFLHERTVPAIIHRDFKSGNILLDHNYRAKVSDFGLAKMGSDKINGQISTRVLGTAGYLAPEYASSGNLTTKSDVYSYGVVLLELLTGRVPIDSERPPGEHVLVSWALPRLTNREKVEEMVDPALQGKYSKKELIQIAAIAAVCVQSEADYRPLMTDVVQSLIPLVKSLISSGPSTTSTSHYQTVIQIS